MRCEIDRAILAEMLAGVVNALPGKTTYPVLQNVLMTVSGGRLSLAGTDLDTFVRKDFTLDGSNEDGTAILAGRKLGEMVREIGDQRITISTKGTNLTLEAGRTRASFTGLDPAEFPELPKLPEGTTLELPLAAVLEVFDDVAFAVAREESRPAMSGLNWEVTKTELRMVATDGHRLALVARKGKFPAKAKLLISPRIISLFPRGEEKVLVHLDPARAGFVFQGTTIITRLIEGPYPDYERVIPKGYPTKAVVEHSAFASALRRAAVFAHPVGKLVSFEFKKGKLRLVAETPELGRSEEEVDCDFNGEALRIGFNANYLLEILRHLASDQVLVELSNPLSAGLFKPSENKPESEATYLLMPIRLD